MPRRSNFCQFSLRFTLLLSVSFRGPSWASIAFIYTTPGRPGNEFVRHITLKFYAHFTSLVCSACPWTSDDAPVLKWERRERINIRVISGKEQDRNESEIEEGEDDSFVMHLSAAIPGGDPGEPPVICTTTSTNSHYPKPNLCNLIQDGNDINLDWTYRKDALMNAVSDFIPTKKVTGKNTPPWITSQIIHAPRKKEAACSKLKKSPTDHQQQNYRELRTKAKTLIPESREMYFSSLDSDLARQPKRFGPFLSSRIKRGPSLKRWARAMTISRALKHQRLNKSPSCLTLTLCQFSLLPQRSALCQLISRPHTPHVRGGNGFDISQTAWYKQSNWTFGYSLFL